MWEAGGDSFVGENRPCGRATVEKDFWLRLVEQTGQKFHARSPFRWFQREDTDEQIETEIPNVISIDRDASVDNDAATCKILIKNTLSLKYGEFEEAEGVWGKPGFFSFSRGSSQEAKARWGQTGNEWSGVLQPNALIRTYEGYGGHDKEIAEAVTDGNLVLTGVWLVDEVSLTANNNLSLSCRDMMKLLIEQQLYPPFMPARHYPLEYYRYVLESKAIPPAELPSSASSAIGLPCHYGCNIGGSASSSTDALNGYNAAIHGHRPTDAFDSSPEPPGRGPGEIAHQETFWLSNGHNAANGGSVFEWIEMCCEDQNINKVYIHPWGGSYQVYVSVWENGGWVYPEDSGQGGIIPYSGSDYTGSNTAAIPYVNKLGVKWEGWDREVEHILPRVYRASKIRLTFTNLTRSQWGSKVYRCGVRKMYPAYDKHAGVTGGYLKTFACYPYPKVDSDAVGYWQAYQNGSVFAFGDARTYPTNASSPFKTHVGWCVGMCANHEGDGYWTLGSNGRVIAYGAAAHYGDGESIGSGFTSIAPTPTGDGYWLLHRSGTVYSYGDATSHGNSSHSASLPSGAPAIAHGIESHPSTSGYWVLWTDGHVDAKNLTDHGSASRPGFTATEYVSSIRRTSTGDGYWIVSGGGAVQRFGDAFNHGSATRYDVTKWADSLVWDFVPNWNSDGGYALQRADGSLVGFGDWEYFGSIAEGFATLRKDGNYEDYSDIVKELVAWAGFLLYTEDEIEGDPEIYGNIESTGAYAKEPLPREMFDKVPVMNAITALKEIVGYIVRCDAEGGFRFESPNWWSLGNYDYEGNELDLIPVVDEKVNLTDYSVSKNDQDSRSEIIISTDEPTENFSSTLTTRIVPQTAPLLKGMVKPAQWINGLFLSKKEQEIMAELIAIHIWFGQRVGNVTCWANPCIEINDQVRVYERTTGETFVHYVRGLSSRINNETGEYTMTLSTNWLGGSPFNTRPLFFAADGLSDGSGYWQARNDGQVWAFGDVDLYPTDETHRDWVTALQATLTGNGYYTLDISGKVIAYGDAVHYGDLSRTENDIVDMALTTTGEGYWLLGNDGSVYEFGDATDYGDVTVSQTPALPSGDTVRAISIESHPTAGWWVLAINGQVYTAGSASNYGNANRDDFYNTEYVSKLRRTPSGNGYWIVSGGARVQYFGDALNYGSGELYDTSEWVDGLVWDFFVSDDGYALQHADGNVDFLGAYVDQGEANVRDMPEQMEWALIPNQNTETVDPSNHLVVPPACIEFLGKTDNPSANKAVASGFEAKLEPTGKA